MEVKGIGQGGQANIELGRSNDKIEKVTNGSSLVKIKSDDNKNIENKDISEKELKNAVGKLNKFLEDNKTHAEYEYHDKLKNDLMIRIVDNESGKVVQEVPPRKILDMVAKMLEMVGILIDKRA
jgi:flagellar protein FlaG